MPDDTAAIAAPSDPMKELIDRIGSMIDSKLAAAGITPPPPPEPDPEPAPAPIADEGSSTETRLAAIEAWVTRVAPVAEELLSTASQITGGSIGSVLLAAAKGLGHL